MTAETETTAREQIRTLLNDRAAANRGTGRTPPPAARERAPGHAMPAET